MNNEGDEPFPELWLQYLFILFFELYHISTSLSSYIRHGRYLARFALQHRPCPHHPTGLCVGVGFPENPWGHHIKPLTTAWLWALTLVKNWHSTPGQRTVRSLTSWPHRVHCTRPLQSPWLCSPASCGAWEPIVTPSILSRTDLTSFSVCRVASWTSPDPRHQLILLIYILRVYVLVVCTD